MRERLRNLPTWLRLLLAASPILICIPLLCLVVFLYQSLAGGQVSSAAATATAAQAALNETGTAVQGLPTSVALTSTAAAAAITQAALENMGPTTATALAISNATAQAQSQALTLTAASVPTRAATPTLIIPSDTPAAIFVNTPTPKTVTITLRECRGFEGTVLFGDVQPQSLHANSTLNFTVPPGVYHLHILWLTHPSDNVDMQVDASSSQEIPLGGC
jgi:hypothetical protein